MRSYFPARCRNSSVRRRPAFQPRLEQLEDRALLAFGASLVGPQVVFHGDAASDTLVLDVDPATQSLRHNRMGDPGFLSPIDLDSSRPGIQSAPIQLLGNIAISSGEGDDQIVLGSTQSPASRLTAQVNLQDQGGTDLLEFADLNNDLGLLDVVVSGTSVTGIGGPVTFSNMERLNINLGNGNDTVNVLGTQAGTPVHLNTGLGTNLIRVGNLVNTIDDVDDRLFLTCLGPTRVDVIDFGTTTPRRFTLHPAMTGGVTLSIDLEEQIQFVTFDFTNVYISGSQAPSIYEVDDLPFSFKLTITAGAASDRFFVGGQHRSLDNVGNLELDGGGGNDRAEFLDDGTVTPQSYENRFEAPATELQFRPARTAKLSSVESLVFFLGGSGGSTFHVLGTDPATTTQLMGTTGNDVFKIGNEANSLDSVQGQLSINGGGGFDVCRFFDQGNTVPQAFLVDSSTVFRGSVLVSVNDIDGGEIHGGRAGNTFEIRATSAGTPFSIFTGSGDDTVTFGTELPQVTLNEILSTVALDGQGGVNSVYFRDRSWVNAAVFELLNDRLARNSFVVATYQNFLTRDLSTGSGDNTIFVTGTGAGTVTRVHGGFGNEAFYVRGQNDQLADFQGELELTGGGGNDALEVWDTGNATGQNCSIFVEGIHVLGEAIPKVRFVDAIEIMRYSFGVAADRIYLESVGQGTVVSLDTGGGDDELHLSPTAQDQSTIASNVIFDGGAGYDRVFIYDQQTSSSQTHTFDGDRVRVRFNWQLLHNDSEWVRVSPSQSVGGSIFVPRITWEVIVDLSGTAQHQIVVGNSGNSLAEILSPITVNGVPGQYTVDVNDHGRNAAVDYVVTANSVATSDLGQFIVFNVAPGRVNLRATGGSNLIVVEDDMVYTLYLEGGMGTNRLLGPDRANAWSLTSINAGTLNNLVSFFDVVHVVGGTDADTFAFAQGGGLTGDLDGGAGVDSLNYESLTTNIVANLALGASTGVGGTVTEIENVRGGSGDDILCGNELSNTLDGGPGWDLLIGGRSVGPAAADTLLGGGGEDILVAGSTMHDHSPAALDAILAEWTRPTSYATRVNHLLTGNGVPALNARTIAYNRVPGGNTLIGGTEVDLFFGQRARETDDWEGLPERFIPIGQVVRQAAAIS